MARPRWTVGMNTAYPIQTSARPGIVQRIRAALAGWTPAARPALTREELALRHEQFREAQRLLEAARTSVYLARSF